MPDDREAANSQTGRFDVAAIAAAFPPTTATMLLDRYLSDKPEASVRVFRVYRTVPPHFHRQCDEYLYILSGRGMFWMGDESTVAQCRPGQLLHFTRGTIHAMPEILEEPLVFLAIDAPRRDPTDVIFVDPKDGTPETFIRSVNY